MCTSCNNTGIKGYIDDLYYRNIVSTPRSIEEYFQYYIPVICHCIKGNKKVKQLAMEELITKRKTRVANKGYLLKHKSYISSLEYEYKKRELYGSEN